MQVAAVAAAVAVVVKPPAAAVSASWFLSGAGVPALCAFALLLRAAAWLPLLPCVAYFLRVAAELPLLHVPTWQPPLPSQDINRGRLRKSKLLLLGGIDILTEAFASAQWCCFDGSFTFLKQKSPKNSLYLLKIHITPSRTLEEHNITLVQAKYSHPIFPEKAMHLLVWFLSAYTTCSPVLLHSGIKLDRNKGRSGFDADCDAYCCYSALVFQRKLAKEMTLW